VRRAGELLGRLPLDDDRGFVGRPRRVEQLPHQGGGDAVGHVRNDVIWRRRQRHREEVTKPALDACALGESLSEPPVWIGVLFDGQDAIAGLGESRGERTVASAWLDDESARWESERPYERAGDVGVAQEVLR